MLKQGHDLISDTENLPHPSFLLNYEFLRQARNKIGIKMLDLSPVQVAARRRQFSISLYAEYRTSYVVRTVQTRLSLISIYSSK